MNNDSPNAMLPLIDGEPGDVVPSFFVSRLQALDKQLGEMYVKIRGAEKALPSGDSVETAEERESLLGALAKVVMSKGIGKANALAQRYVTTYSQMFLYRVMLHKSVLLIPDLDDDTRAEHEGVLKAFRKAVTKSAEGDNAEEAPNCTATVRTDADTGDAAQRSPRAEEAAGAETQQLAAESSTAAASSSKASDGDGEGVGDSVPRTRSAATGKPVGKRAGSRRKGGK